MSRLRMPVAAAGLAAAVVLGGVCATGALADEGDGGSSSLSADPSTTAPAGTGLPAAGAGADTAADPDTGTSTGADTGSDAGVAADPGAGGTDTGGVTGTDSGTDAGTEAGTDTGSGAAVDTGTATDPGTAGAGTAPDATDAMQVSPATVAPGGQVTLRLKTSCTAGHRAQASATVFVSDVTLAPASDGSDLEASAFIRSDAAGGSYTISVRCDGVKSSASASITVVASGGATTTPSTPLTPATPLWPVKPVPAGGGGTAQLAAGPAAAGASAGPLLATGLFAAAGLAGAAVRRGRRGGTRG